MILSRRGLGTASGTTLPYVKSTLFGFQVDCSNSLQYYTSPVCWGTSSLSDYESMANAATESAVLAAGPTPIPLPGAPQTAEQAANWTPEDAISSGIANTTAAWDGYFSNVQSNLAALATPDTTADNSWFWALLAFGGVAALLLLRR